jgi:hypothetical protein
MDHPGTLRYIFAIIGSGPENQGIADGLLIFHLPDDTRASAYRHRDQCAKPSGRLEGDAECPHCGEVHEISVRETYINGAMSDVADRLRLVI